MIRESHLRTCARTKNAKGKSSSGPRGICLVKRSEVLGLNDFKAHHGSDSGTRPTRSAHGAPIGGRKGMLYHVDRR